MESGIYQVWQLMSSWQAESFSFLGKLAKRVSSLSARQGRKDRQAERPPHGCHEVPDHVGPGAHESKTSAGQGTAVQLRFCQKHGPSGGCNEDRSEDVRPGEAAEHKAEHGKQLRKYRRLWGMDLEYVARLAGLTKSTLSKFECGRNDLRVEAYTRLLDAMEQIGEARSEVLAFENRALDARSRGMTMLAELAGNSVPREGGEELKAWRAEQTKNKIDHRKMQSYAERMNEKYQVEIAELRDLLNLETEAALKESERDELRKKIKSRDSGEEEE